MDDDLTLQPLGSAAAGGGGGGAGIADRSPLDVSQPRVRRGSVVRRISVTQGASPPPPGRPPSASQSTPAVPNSRRRSFAACQVVTGDGLGQIVLDVPVHSGSAAKPDVVSRLEAWKPPTPTMEDMESRLDAASAKREALLAKRVGSPTNTEKAKAAKAAGARATMAAAEDVRTAAMAQRGETATERRASELTKSVQKAQKMGGSKVDEVQSAKKAAEDAKEAALDRRMRLAAKSREMKMAMTVEKAAEMGGAKVTAASTKLGEKAAAKEAALAAKHEEAAARREAKLREAVSPSKLAPAKRRASARPPAPSLAQSPSGYEAPVSAAVAAEQQEVSESPISDAGGDASAPA